MVRVTSSVRRQWREYDGLVGVLLKTKSAADEATAVAEAIVQHISEITIGDSDMLSVDVQRTPKGPVILLIDCGDLDRALNWIIEGLTERGLDDATLTTMPIVRPYHGHGLLTSAGDELGVVSAFLAIRGMPSETNGVRHWTVSEEDTEAALNELIAWALALPGGERVADLCTGQVYTRVMTSDVLPAMRLRAHRLAPHRLQTNSAIVYAGSAFRQVEVLPDMGLAMAAQGSEVPADFDWESALRDITSVLRAVGPWCVYGHATRGFQPPQTIHPYHGSLQGKHLRTEEQRMAAERGQLFDAFGVMRLRPAQVEGVDLEGWRLSSTSTQDQVLLQHNSPDRWFRDERVDQSTLSAARSLFSERLLDPTGEKDVDAWEMTRQRWAYIADRYPGSTPPNYWERRRGAKGAGASSDG